MTIGDLSNGISTFDLGPAGDISLLPPPTTLLAGACGLTCSLHGAKACIPPPSPQPPSPPPVPLPPAGPPPMAPSVAGAVAAGVGGGLAAIVLVVLFAVFAVPWIRARASYVPDEEDEGVEASVQVRSHTSRAARVAAAQAAGQAAQAAHAARAMESIKQASAADKEPDV